MGDTLEDITQETDSVVSGSFAPFISNASYQIKHNEEIISAIMISCYEGHPLISEIFTNKHFYNLGLASTLIKKSINSLLELGYTRLTLYVDTRNTVALNLYKKIGFK